MDSKAIQKKMDMFADMLLAKGKTKPEVEYHIASGKEEIILMRWSRIGGASYDHEYEWIRGGDLFAKANAFIANLPTPEETARNEFASLLAKALEYGRAKGFSDVMINPLAEAMKTLSDNIITDGREVGE